VTKINDRDARVILSKDLLVSKTPGAYLLKQQQEMAAVEIVTGRRRVLRTFALTMASGAIGLASAAAKPAAATVESALTPPGATHLDALQKRLAQAPRRRDFKTVPMILNHPEQWESRSIDRSARLQARAQAGLGRCRHRNLYWGPDIAAPNMTLKRPLDRRPEERS
jgi:hypothetical protein